MPHFPQNNFVVKRYSAMALLRAGTRLFFSIHSCTILNSPTSTIARITSETKVSRYLYLSIYLHPHDAIYTHLLVMACTDAFCIQASYYALQTFTIRITLETFHHYRSSQQIGMIVLHLIVKCDIGKYRIKSLIYSAIGLHKRFHLAI